MYLVTALVFLVTLCAAKETHYWRYPFTGVPTSEKILAYHPFDPTDDLDEGAQLREFISNLRTACSANPKCAGFTSDGRLLFERSVNLTKPSSSMDLYVKKESPQAADPFIWPLPQTVVQGATTLQLSPVFQFLPNPSFPDILDAISWVTSFTFQHKGSSVSLPAVSLPALLIVIQNPTAPLQIGVDESYSLNIPVDGSPATLKAVTFYGALNGLQTFSQLVIFDFNTQTYQIKNAPYAIIDAPRFSHRGVLIDSSRHFQPIPILRKVVDSLAFAKFNVLHWHVVDSQSFPFESKTYPKLWNGAYSGIEKYTQNDIIDLVEYARQRNVRVMVEFDTPGHAASWCTGYPEVCPSTSCLQPLNPATESTFNLIKSLFSECTGNAAGAGLFPSSMIHLGGDEVDTSCWTKTPSINAWLAANNFTADDAYLYFVNRVLAIVLSQSRDPVNWEEVYNHFRTKLDKRIIVHAWYNFSTLAASVKDGYRSLLSTNWYLDHLNDLWTEYYNNEPAKGIVDPAQQKLILGGECCMWGETVDPSDIFNTIWPRAAAVAERLWSPSNVIDTSKALPRYENFRCVLNSRGVAAAPSHNKAARQPPPEPGSCLLQK